MKRFRMTRRRRVFAVLPTMLTLGNAVCGFGAITFAAKVGLLLKLGWATNMSDTRCLFVAAILVFFAMIFDMLDGRAARWARQTSQFGAELDSLCDAISFGVAPAIILIKFSTDFHPRLLWVIAVLFMVCAILRLARFNVETEEDDSHEYFSGLPSPAAAGTVVSFMIAYQELEDQAAPLADGAGMWPTLMHEAALWLLPALKMLVPLVALSCALLMVSRVRYAHLFNQWFRGRRNRRHIVQVVLGTAAVFLMRELAVPLIFCLFAFVAPVRAGWRRIWQRTPWPAKTLPSELAQATDDSAPQVEDVPR